MNRVINAELTVGKHFKTVKIKEDNIIIHQVKKDSELNSLNLPQGGVVFEVRNERHEKDTVSLNPISASVFTFDFNLKYQNPNRDYIIFYILGEKDVKKYSSIISIIEDLIEKKEVSEVDSELPPAKI